MTGRPARPKSSWARGRRAAGVGPRRRGALGSFACVLIKLVDVVDAAAVVPFISTSSGSRHAPRLEADVSILSFWGVLGVLMGASSNSAKRVRQSR